MQSRWQSTAAVPIDAGADDLDIVAPPPSQHQAKPKQHQQQQHQRRAHTKLAPEALPSPHPQRANQSAKLAALRSRLSLSPRFPLETLARTLVHPSADPDPNFNNASLSILGSNLLGYYITEHLLCNYPRLPMSVIFAAQYAYIGPKALATIAGEWGIQAAAVPGGEVEPGLLQFQRIRSGDPMPEALQEHPKSRKWNITTTHKIMNSDNFGSDRAAPPPERLAQTPIPIETAAQSFVQALVGSLHLHSGRPIAKRFFRDHFLSRHLDLSALFDFRTPTRDLSRLCAREGFEAPVARLVSETGRLSRHPVFIVGVYSGKDKLGEGAGSSLDEARTRAAVAALKGWYLYRPVDVTVPSSTEGMDDTGVWKRNMIDCGEVIV